MSDEERACIEAALTQQLALPLLLGDA